MRRINTLLRGVSQKTHVGGANGGHAHSGESNMLHVVDMFGFENCEVVCECECVCVCCVLWVNCWVKWGQHMM